MNLYPTYDRHIMEAIRQLTVEEMLCVVHDIAFCITEDRLRDYGPSRAMGTGDAIPVRPGWISLRALDHALRTFDFPTPGFQQHEDLVEAFGEDVAAGLAENQFKVEQYLSNLGDIMLEYDVSMRVAILIDAAKMRDQDFDVSTLRAEDIPDTLDGFGWRE